MNTLLLNTAAAPLLPTQAAVGAAAVAAVAADFASTLAVQQHASLPNPQVPAAELPMQDPTLAEDGTMPPLLPAAPGAPTVAPAGADAEDSGDELPPLDGETSYALAALGLWQTAPAVAPTLHPAAVGAQRLAQTLGAREPNGKSSFDAAQPEQGARTAVLSQGVAETVLAQESSGKSSFGSVQPEQGTSAAGGAAGDLEFGTLLPGLAPDGVKPAAGAAAGVALTPSSLVLKGEPTQWQQPLLQALGDRLQVQIAGRSEQAVIRLEPPLLGQVEIAIRQQAGELQVRMSATHEDVVRQLRQVSDSLRQDLVQRHSGDVTVQVAQSARGDDGRQPGRDAQSQQQAQDQREQQQQRRPGRALSEEDSLAASGFAPALTAADIPA